LPIGSARRRGRAAREPSRALLDIIHAIERAPKI
jgi:hypothetical protein